MFIRAPQDATIFIGICGNKNNLTEMWTILGAELDLEPPVPLNGNVYLGYGQTT